jgi:hypothetical protein
MHKFALSAVMVCLLAGPAHSQSKQPDEKGSDSKTLMQIEQEERAKRAKEVDADYQRAIKGTRQTGAPSAAPDPWQSVRPAPPSKDKKPN